MQVDFIHLGSAYLPELSAYQSFLREQGHTSSVHRSLASVPQGTKVVWWMCGRVTPTMARRFPQAFHIHEYASASIPPSAWLKDRIKRWSQARPDYRIFLNEWVRHRFSFNDDVPCELRDMGIDPDFLSPGLPPPLLEFDFVYLGEMRRLWHFLPLLEALAQLGRRVLLIGEPPPALVDRLQPHGTFEFTGQVPHASVPHQLRRARYGLNLIPDQPPYNQQTSTKLLEYCACGLGIVSTDYSWAREFEASHKARFFFIPPKAPKEHYRSLLGASIDNISLTTPDMCHLGWPARIATMAIWKQLHLPPSQTPVEHKQP